jgi:hypothetical protein
MNLRKLIAPAFLTGVLGLAAFVGTARTLACVPPLPGQTEIGPCAVAPSDETPPSIASTTSDEMSGPTTASDETSLTEIAAKAYLTFLSLF